MDSDPQLPRIPVTIARPPQVNVLACPACIEACSISEYDVVGLSPAQGICISCSGLGTTMVRARAFEPRAIAWGPLPVSSTALAPIVRIVWDVNGYYRMLGVKTDATRKEIRQAYSALGGPDDWLLTYIVKQLIQPEVREAYDASPPGSVFFDEVIARMVKRRMIEDAAQHRADGGDEEDLAPIDLSDMMNKSVAPDPEPTKAPSTAQTFRWRAFAWCSNRKPDDLLQAWMSVINEQLARLGANLEYAVGWVGRPGLRSVTSEVQGIPVAWLSDSFKDLPSIYATREVARQLIELSTSSNTNTPSNPQH